MTEVHSENSANALAHKKARLYTRLFTKDQYKAWLSSSGCLAT